MAKYEMTIGLETHVELSTKTKIFCSCSTGFGADPNTHCCPVCIGLPGSLPKLNRAVVEYAVKAGLALNCHIANTSKMDRKNYVYPDLSKAYQISQFDFPLCYQGYVELSDGHRIRINRIHIEEDAGKLVHEAGDTYIDYNRGGVPLIEIVTEPDFHTVEQVREYIEKIRLTMKTLGVSDCKMQEGSLRCDVNISLRPEGQEELGTRTEIKNVSSVSFIVKAIEAEYERQVDALENHEKIIQETRRYSESSNSTEPMRDKEDSNDYRYFREPDLPYVRISNEKIDKIRKNMPELPDAKLARYMNELGLSREDALQFVKYPKLSQYFDTAVKLSGNAKLCTGIMLTQLYKFMETDEAKENAEINITAENMAEVAKMVSDGEIGNNMIKKIIEKMQETGKPFGELFSKEDFAVASGDEIAGFVDEVMAANPQAVEDLKNGKMKAIGAIMGQVMRKAKGKANPQEVQSLIMSKIK